MTFAIPDGPRFARVHSLIPVLILTMMNIPILIPILIPTMIAIPILILIPIPILTLISMSDISMLTLMLTLMPTLMSPVGR